jgi:hypothetical protein
MKTNAVAQQIDIASGILGRSRQFAAFGLNGQGGSQQSTQKLGLNL